MVIYKITSYIDKNKYFKRLDSQLNKLMNQNLIKVPKVVEPAKHKTKEIKTV